MASKALFEVVRCHADVVSPLAHSILRGYSSFVNYSTSEAISLYPLQGNSFFSLQLQAFSCSLFAGGFVFWWVCFLK